jgi:hypothetical protein
MATTKKTTKSSSKAKPKSSSIKSTIKTAGKAAIIPGYAGLSLAKAIDDKIEKLDPSLSKSKTYKAVKTPVKAVKKGIDYASDKAIDFTSAARDVITNPGKYIEKGAAKVGKLAAKGMKAIDDKIEKLDPSLTKSKLYGAVKSVAKKAPKAIETGVGIAGKGAAMFNPVAGSAVAGREAYKGGKAVGKYAVKKVKQGVKALDDKIEKYDPELTKSKTYNAVKGAAKSVLGVKSGNTSKKAAPAKTSTSKVTAKTPPAKTTPKTTQVKNTPPPAKTTSPTVSQLWQQKTGTSWSEAKKQGLTDGSAKSNIALMKKLQSGSVNKNTIKADSAKKTFEKEMNQNIQDELSGKTSYEAPTPASKGTADKAADENKMRKGGMVRRKMQTGGMYKNARLNPTGRKTAMKAMGIKRPTTMITTRPNTMMNRMQAGGAMKTIKKAVKSAIKSTPEYQAYKVTGKLAKNVDDKLQKRYPNYTGKGSAYNTVKKGVKAVLGYQAGGDTTSVGGYMAKGNPGFTSAEKMKKGISKKPSGYTPAAGATKKMKTGGMVNSNSKVSAIKSAGSKGVRTGANTRVTASKIARGRVGGTSTAPRTAAPKAKMGMSVRRRK